MDDLERPPGDGTGDLLVGTELAAELRSRSAAWASLALDHGHLGDLELVVSGAFRPLAGYPGRADHESVCASLRLGDGRLWPVPVTLDVPDDLARRLAPGSPLALRDPEGVLLAVVSVQEVWRADPEVDALAGLPPGGPRGAGPPPGGAGWRVSGPVQGVQLPTHHDHPALRMGPGAVRAELDRRGWRQVAYMPVSAPLHGADLDGMSRAMAGAGAGAGLVVHAQDGPPGAGPVDHFALVRCLRAALATGPFPRALLALGPPAGAGLPGPRRALAQAVMARNLGCSHVVVGAEGMELVGRHRGELGVTPLVLPQVAWVEERGAWLPAGEAGPRGRSLSTTEVGRRLDAGLGLPPWFAPPAVAAELVRSHPPRSRQGVTVFFTGLSGSGKSTIANLVLARLLEGGARRATLLDGDVVRRHLSSELGFGRADRDINVRRIGFVASEITRHGGVALCAPIAPYDATRKQVRAMVEAVGAFVLVHVSTPLEVCESRDRKGLYARARAGELAEFTGISDPYEEPTDAEVVIDTTASSVAEAAGRVLAHLEAGGWLPAGGPGDGPP